MPSRAAIQQRQPRGTDLVAVPPFLVELAHTQCGVVTRQQLALAGVTEAQIRAAVAARRWRAFGRNVVVLQNAPLTQLQREWVAVLLPDKPASLAGPSAAASAGLQGFEPDRVHIVVPHDTQTRFPSWVKVHESRRFTAKDIAPALHRRGLAPPARWSTRPPGRNGRVGHAQILCAAVQQRLVTADQLEAELRDAGRIRHVAIMREILGDIGGGGHTLAEIDLASLARRAGLGAPRRQRLRREPDGRVRWLDAQFALPDGTVLVVEVDGAAHMQVESWVNDSDRQNEIVIGKQPVLRFPSLTIRLNQLRVVDQLRRMRLAHTP